MCPYICFAVVFMIYLYFHVTKPGCAVLPGSVLHLTLSSLRFKIKKKLYNNCVFVFFSPTLAVMGLLAPCLLHSLLHLLVFYNRTKWRCYVTVLLLLLLCFVTLTLSSFRGHCQQNNPMRSQVSMHFIIRYNSYKWAYVCVKWPVRRRIMTFSSDFTLCPESWLSGIVVKPTENIFIFSLMCALLLLLLLQFWIS